MPENDKASPVIVQDLKTLRAKSGLATTQDAESILPRLRIVLGANPRGMGLSAIQMGYPVRLFTTRFHDGFLDFVNPMYIINPEGVCEDGVEGCLSLPGRQRRIKRYSEVTIRCENWGGAAKTFHGLAARVVQHEMDHLDGKTIMERGNPMHGGSKGRRK